MKKLYYILFAIISMFCFTKVANAQEYVLFGECYYENTYVDGSVYTKHVDDNIRNEASNNGFRIGYSEVLSKSVSKTVLFARSDYDSKKWYQIDEGNAIFSQDKFDGTGRAMIDSFYKYLPATEGLCPEYLIFKKTDDKGKKVAAIFVKDADELKSSCGADNKECRLVSKRNTSSAIANLHKYPSGELTWDNDNNGNTIQLKILDSGQMGATFVIPQSSFAWTKSAQREGGVEARVIKLQGREGIQALYRLANQSRVDFISYNFANGKEEIHIAIDKKKTKNTWINVDEPYFSRKYNCKTYDAISSVVENSWTNVKNATILASPNSELYYFFKYGDRGISGYVRDESTGLYVIQEKFKRGGLADADYKTAKEKVDDLQTKLDKWYSSIQSFDDTMKKVQDGMCASAADELAQFINNKDTNLNSYKLIRNSVSEVQKLLSEEAARHNDAEFIARTENNIEKGEEQVKNIETISVSLKQDYVNLIADGSLTKSGKFISGCDTIKSLNEVLQTILDYIRIIGILLAVILQVVEYIKVIFGSGDDSMAKANKKLSVRLIAVALLFLIPAIVGFILGLFNIPGASNAGTCGIV